MNILNFDRWLITNEGFTAEVEDDNTNINNKEKNEIEIEIAKDHNVTYTIIGDKVTSKETLKSEDITGDSIGSQKTIELEIDDIKLKKDIINASNAIKDIKERERAKEILRLTGGDENTPVSQRIIGIYDNKDSNEIRRKHTDANGNTIEYSLYTELEKLEPNFWKETGAYCYLQLNGIKGQNDMPINIISTYNDIIMNTVGKGEFLLPLIFTDVYKHKAHGYKKYDNDTLSIGDNYILHVNNNIEHIYDIETKGPKAGFKFDKDNIYSQKLKLKNGKYRIYNKEENNDDYKNAIVSKFLSYLNTQSEKRKNLCICFFDVQNNIPQGVLFINVSGAKNIDATDTTSQLFSTLKELIYIIPGNKKGKTSCNTAYDFEYAANGLKINCKLNNELYYKKFKKRTYNRHKDSIIETNPSPEYSSIIYNFENFVNEYYTK